MFLKLLQDMDGSRPHATEQATESIANLSRRGFIAGAAVFVVGVSLGQSSRAASEESAGTLADASGGDASPALWISIETDGTIALTCHRSEMGQQVWTAMAQIIADELEADWGSVRIVQAIGHPKYSDQNTDGSRSVRFNLHRLRLAGAAMRSMLVTAAAQKWAIDPGQCSSELGQVTNTKTGARLSYTELAESASALPLPLESELSLKSRDQWRYIGKPVPSLTVPMITRGEGTYGIDVDRPGMVYAVVARPPEVFATTGAIDDSKARQIPGVLSVHQLPDAEAPVQFKPLGGVAVVATDTWAAIQGRKALEIDWQAGPNASHSSDGYRQDLQQATRTAGQVRRNRGDTVATLGAAEKTISAEYYVPFLAQTPMEPPAATAEWKDGHLSCWAAVQDPQSTRNTVAGFLGIDVNKVTVHATWLGGAFGRKSKPDFVIEAALIAREVGKPVKVTWTREDDVKHGYYHAVSAQRFEGALDDAGNCTALLHRTAFPGIPSLYDADAINASGMELGLGASDNPFNVANLRLESGQARAPLRIGWMRSVANIYHAFGVQSFAAELAHAAGRDPKDYLLDLIGPDRIIDPTQEGATDYPNYGGSKTDYPLDTGRLSNVTRIAAKMSGWGRSLPKGHGLGIAAHRSFLTYIATVIEVKVDEDGVISIPKVWLAADAGTVVNPAHSTAQLEGGTLYGLSNALYGEITITDGVVDQDNFPQWRVMRMHEAPRAFDVHIVESNAPPAGIGEPATPPAAPALANAIFAACGKRVRDLPVLGPNANKLTLKPQQNS